MIAKAWSAALMIAVVALVLGGCAHTPTPHYYVLSGAKRAAAPAGEGPSIGLGPITLPDYLDRPQIVTRATDSRLVLSNEHRWAEPLAASFARALLADLAAAAPGRDIAQHPWPASTAIARQVRIDVTRFDRDVDGRFHLGARWRITTPEQRELAPTHDSDIEVEVSGKADDYDALLAAANSAVAQLANAIANELQAP